MSRASRKVSQSSCSASRATDQVARSPRLACPWMLLRCRELEVGEFLDASEEVRAAMEPAAQLVVVGALLTPAQDASLEWPEPVVTGRSAGRTVERGEEPDLGNPLPAVSEPATDLVIGQAGRDPAQHSSFDGPQLLGAGHRRSPLGRYS